MTAPDKPALKAAAEVCPDCRSVKAKRFSFVNPGECPVGVAQPLHGCDMKAATIHCQELTIALLRTENARLLAELEEARGERAEAERALDRMTEMFDEQTTRSAESAREGAWVRCDERMPADEEPVWIFEDGWAVAEAYRELDTWRAPEGWRHSGMKPTHWRSRYVQPRPAPSELPAPPTTPEGE